MKRACLAQKYEELLAGCILVFVILVLEMLKCFLFLSVVVRELCCM